MKKGTWIVIGLAVVLGMVYFLSREKQVSVGVKQLKLPAFMSEKIDRIEISSKEKVDLRKLDGIWKLRLASDGKTRDVKADQANVSSLLEAAESLRSSHYVTNLKDKYEELGFTNDATVVVSLFSADKPVWTVQLGKTAGGGGRYAKLDAEDDIYVLKGSFWQLTRNGVVDFRDREIWPVKEGEIDKFSITKEDGSQILLVKDDGSWIVDPKMSLSQNFRVDKNAVSQLVKNGSSLRAAGFIDDEKDLISPKLVVNATSKDQVYVLKLFAAGEDKYFAKLDSDPQIYEVTKHNFDRLDSKIDALRDLSLMQFDKSAIKEISLVDDKHRAVVAKSDNGWQLNSPKNLPEKFEFDSSAVDDLLTVMSTLSAERIANDKDVVKNKDWQKAPVIEMTTDKGEKIRLYAGQLKTNKDEYLVRGNADEEIYVVKAARLNSLLSGVNAFKKVEIDMPPINENTKGFESLPPDIQRKLLNVTKEKQ